MNVGDYVGLKQPFRPSSRSSQVYHFGIVAGVLSGRQNSDVLVHLYDPDPDLCYTDECNAKAIYHFHLNEIELLPLSSELIDNQNEDAAA